VHRQATLATVISIARSSSTKLKVENGKVTAVYGFSGESVVVSAAAIFS